MESVDLVVVGAGPAGISLAVEARHAGVEADRIRVIEKAKEHSWAIRTLYPDSKLVTANYKGIDAQCEGVMCLLDSSKHETLTYLDRAIADNDVRVQYESEVFAIDVQDEGGFIVRTSRGDLRAKVVVIAIGIFGRPNKPDYPVPKVLTKERCLFDVTSVAIEREKVLVVGGGDSASEYCQFLVGRQNRVTLSYRKTEFGRMLDLNRESILALEARDELTILRGSTIRAVEEETGKPRVVFSSPEQTVVYDRVIYALGGSTPQNFLKTIGVHFHGDDPHLVDGHETSVPGLFLSGDLTAGRKGGSIIAAFNASRRVMEQICDKYLGCRVAPVSETRTTG
jgi:thioredoxin reductase (NADPH)